MDKNYVIPKEQYENLRDDIMDQLEGTIDSIEILRDQAGEAKIALEHIFHRLIQLDRTIKNKIGDGKDGE